MNGGRITRSSERGDLARSGRTNFAEKGFIETATILWNQAPREIRTTSTISSAKTKIRMYSKTLTI